MVEIRVSDATRARDWYVQSLGLTVRMEDPAGGFVLLEGGGVGLALKAGEAHVAGRDAVRLAFEVEDVEAERARLVSRSVEIGEVAENTAEGYREVRLLDLDGTPITLFSSIRPGGSL